MLALTDITRSFGQLRAVDGVSLSVRPGEIIALVGENGAGKTTLMRIAAGELSADSGTIEIDGRVELVHQHFMLVPELSIAENLALGDSALFRIAGRRTLEREAEAIISSTGIALSDPDRRVSSLSVAEKSKLELAKAISRRPAFLILDEPTSVLTPLETAELFDTLKALAAKGTGIVFISHKLAEVIALAQRILVMRGGRVVAGVNANDADPAMLAAAMIGSPPTAGPANGPKTLGESRLIVMENVSGEVLRDASLFVRSSEILAILGVAGNGQSELAAMLAGLQRPRRGELRIPRRIANIPEDRTRDGIIKEMTIAENIALRAKRWQAAEASRLATKAIESYSIRARGPHQRAGDLSGGNQQKVLLARELEVHPEAIVAAEPTRGLDVEAAGFVHRRLRDAAGGGAAILLITSDLDEAFALADAVQVIYRGTLSERMDPGEAAKRLGALMAGLR